MHKNIYGRLLAALVLLSAATARAALNDWVEGTAAADDGATRDFYNRAARLGWANYMGDWSDAQGLAWRRSLTATGLVIKNQLAPVSQPGQRLD